MDSTSQQSLTNPGASNGADFQPPTGNPQIPGQIMQQDSSLQNSEIEEVLQNSNARITVPVNPAPTSTQVAEAKSNNWLVFTLIAVAIILLSLHLWRRRTIFLTRPLSPEEIPEVETSVPMVVQSTPERAKSLDPRKKAARKSTKKKKRSRR